MKGQARYKRSPKEERTWNGKVYDSKAEMQYAVKLHALAKEGVITDLREQVPFVICPKTRKGERAMTYRADFVYLDSEGAMHVCDKKGHRTQLFILKRRLMKYLHNIDVEEV